MLFISTYLPKKFLSLLSHKSQKALLIAGCALFLSGGTPAAARQYSPSLIDRETRVNRWIERAEGAIAQADYSTAQTLLEETIEIDSDNPAHYLRLGQVLIEQQSYEQAETALREVIRLEPDSAEGYAELSNALLVQGRDDAAMLSAQRALRLDGQNEVAHFVLGDIYFGARNLEAAAEAYQTAIRLNPEDIESLNNLSYVLRDLDRWDEAEAALRQAVTISADSRYPHIYVHNLGSLLSRQERYEAAEVAYREGIQAYPDSFWMYNLLSRFLRRQGRVQESDAVFANALEMAADDAKAQLYIGSTHLWEGELDASEAILQTALVLDPYDPAIHSRWGELRMAQQDFEGAVDAYERAIELASDDSSLVSRLSSDLGGVLAQLGQLNEAEIAYQQAVNFSPDSHIYYRSLGEFLHAQQRHIEAAAAYREAISLGDSTDTLQVKLGEVTGH